MLSWVTRLRYRFTITLSGIIVFSIVLMHILVGTNLVSRSVPKLAIDPSEKLQILRGRESIDDVTSRGAEATDAEERSEARPLPVTCRCPRIVRDAAAIIHMKNDVDETDPRYDTTGRESLARHHPNIALSQLSGSGRCTLMPSVFQISWTSVHWQLLRNGDGEEMLLYSAVFDNRTNTEPSGGVVRVLVMSKYNITKLPLCHLWYNDQLEPVATRVVRADIIDFLKPKGVQWHPFLLTCPAEGVVSRQTGHPAAPTGVSLVYESCTPASNLLKVNGAHAETRGAHDYQRPERFRGLPEVAVCGPALFFYQEDFSSRLLEWLEVMKALGVSKVFLYVSDVHPNIEKVLRLYESEGFVALTDFRYPSPYVDEPLLRRSWTRSERSKIFSLENVYFSDCLLRNMHRFRYIAHFDPDEVPVLLQHDSLPHLVQYLAQLSVQKAIQPASFGLLWLYFSSDIKDEKSFSLLKKFVIKTLDKTSHENSPTYDRQIQNLANHCRNIFSILLNDRTLFVPRAEMKKNVKPIYDTEIATASGSHFPYVCTAGPCKGRQQRVDASVALTGHFRHPCLSDECTDLNLTYVVGPIRNLRPEVVPKVLEVTMRLNLYASP